MPPIPEDARTQIIDDIASLYAELLSREIKESRDLWFLHSERILDTSDEEPRARMRRVIDILKSVNSGMISERLVLDKLLYGPVSTGLWFSRSYDELSDEVEEVIDKLAMYEAMREVDVPLVNIRVGSEPRSFGLATFYAIQTSDRNDSWWDRIVSYAGTSAETDVVAFARVECPGDLQTAVDYAGWAVDQTLLMIRAIGLQVVSSPQLQFGVLNDYPVWQSRPYRPHQPEENIKFEYASSMVEVLGPPIAPYDIDGDILGSIDESAVYQLQALMDSDLRQPSSEMKSKFFTGLRWLGEATKPDTAAAKFTKLSFALEALVGGDTGEPYLTSRGITAALAERGSFIAGATPSDRFEIHRSITGHYSKRSDIVHGRLDEVQDVDLASFSSLIRAIAWSLLALIDEFNNVDDLQKWVLDHRYGTEG